MFWRDLLSVRVKREFKQYRGTLDRKKPWLERASEGWYLALLFTLPLVVCAAAGLSAFLTRDVQVDDCRSDEIGGRLVTQAQAVGAMLASASGILIAVIVFALEIYRTNLPGGGPLPRLFATRRGYLPTAAFFLGTIASAIVVAAGGQYFGAAAFVRMAWATSGLGVVALVFELLLLQQTIYLLAQLTQLRCKKCLGGGARAVSGQKFPLHLALGSGIVRRGNVLLPAQAFGQRQAQAAQKDALEFVRRRDTPHA